MSIEPGGDRSEIVLHAVEPSGERRIVTSRVVGAKGVEAVGWRKMRHRDDARAVSASCS